MRMARTRHKHVLSGQGTALGRPTNLEAQIGRGGRGRDGDDRRRDGDDDDEGGIGGFFGRLFDFG
jgi:hypothetical protein